MEVNSREVIKKILDECRVIAVVGLSSSPYRPSNGVARYMEQQGYSIIPVNPNEKEIFGHKSYASLAEVPQKIDLVNVFRRPEEAGKVVEQAIDIGAKAVWLQEGVVDRAAAEHAREAGLLVVMDKCWLKEHVRHAR